MKYQGIQIKITTITNSLADSELMARFLAVTAPHSENWQPGLPITSFCLRLDDESIHVAVGVRLGINLFEPHVCRCGSRVNA